MIFLKCKKSDCDVKVIHNVSIFNAISITGLSLYTFGQTVSIVYFTETYQPESFYDKILENLNLGLHTLCLLDIRMHEPTADTILSKNPVYELPRCMKIHEAVEILLKISKKRNCKKITKDTLIVGAARVGTKTEKIVTMTMEQALLPHYIENMGATLHSLVIVGKLDLIEQDIIQIYKLKFDQ
ncbi:hypothetical protein A3Q56_07079 [Intoshia linei]|uniref:Diphthine methyl ester synthase n=1 Tax=Intoshia linei TaxID=1819745 RepID=A0A177AVI3_9BILA|nr:hypothetical protein A3Q56_07079 [Intoshia linei]